MGEFDHRFLESFIIDNPDLNLLESKISSFNIFEAVGMTRQEVRHSYFLSFLLNPSESHYFGDLFLKKFLIAALRSLESPPFSAIMIDVANLQDAEVKREYKNIDILIHSPQEKIVVAIENKIDSGEHSDQLNRYRDIVLTDFPNCQIFLIYLTSKSYGASEEDWHPLSYKMISRCIDDICTQHASKVGTDVNTLMTHYSNLIHKHILNDSDNKQLCHKIYMQHYDAVNFIYSKSFDDTRICDLEIGQSCRKFYKQHYQAITLIYEHRSNYELKISTFLQELIQENKGHDIKEYSYDKKIQFAPKEWDALNIHRIYRKGEKNKQLLLFQFCNSRSYLGLSLVIGQGCSRDQRLKQRICEAVKKIDLPGINKQREISKKGWSTLFTLKFPILEDLYREDETKNEIKTLFEKFLTGDINLIREAINISDLTEEL